MIGRELLAIDEWDKALGWIDEQHELITDAYSFSKECVQVHTMRSAKSTLSAGVRSNSVCPGIIDTPLIPDFEATMRKLFESDKIGLCPSGPPDGGLGIDRHLEHRDPVRAVSRKKHF